MKDEELSEAFIAYGYLGFDDIDAVISTLESAFENRNIYVPLVCHLLSRDERLNQDQRFLTLQKKIEREIYGE